MASVPPAPEKLEAAKEAFELGMSLRDIGKALDVSRETIRRWATAQGWEAPTMMAGKDRRPKPIPSTEDLEAARMRAEKARQEAKARWAVRRSEEADAVGISAGIVRNKVMECVRDDKAADARQYAVVYGIFVDKAQIMSGEGPGRGRQGDEVPLEPRPTDPAAMAEAGRARALRLMPAITAQSTES